ncbi:MAG: hypothetical protein L3J08_01455 [Flavobacteriaceae bacterium]|nr:hypothetical protein [Flavobacteriaceae bacterium]
MRLILMNLFFIFLLISCKPDIKKDSDNSLSARKIVVQEVINIENYTYLRVFENDVEKWVATSPISAEKGAVFYFKNAMEMENFESKELNKTFNNILFIDRLSTTSDLTPIEDKITMKNLSEKATKPIIEKKEITITPSNGTISISEIFKNKENYNNKIISVKGEVTKINPAILNKNWVHLQDGSSFNNDFDLTITTQSELTVGDIVTLKGTLITNKDFGAGYTYSVIIEDAILVE